MPLETASRRTEQQGGKCRGDACRAANQWRRVAVPLMVLRAGVIDYAQALRDGSRKLYNDQRVDEAEPKNDACSDHAHKSAREPRHCSTNGSPLRPLVEIPDESNSVLICR